jgi:superfamily II DNA or RNA helicase
MAVVDLLWPALRCSPAPRLSLSSQHRGDAPAAFVAAFARSPGEGLWLLAVDAFSLPLPEPLAFLRDVARMFLERLCLRPDLDDAPPTPGVEPDPGSLDLLLDRVPPFDGAEYFSLDALLALWRSLDRAVVDLASSFPSFGAFLEARAPLWRRVGRVTFVLAENRRDPASSFAFLATFAHQISDHGAVQQLPLLRALELYGASGQKDRLLRLMAPLERAAAASPFVAQLVESHAVYRPLALSPREALALLRDAPAVEAAGVRVKIPDWWRSRPRPVARVQIGSKVPGSIGADGLLDFDLRVVLGDEVLSEEEIQCLLRSGAGLVQLRGKWVEVDPERLAQALAHWKKAEKLAKQGLSFAEAMRLSMGLQREGLEPQPEEVRSWTRVEPGPWLKETLRRMRAPGAAEPPPGLRGTLRPYQAEGVRWLDLLGELGLGACLADDMGLGKTIQVIGAILARRRRRAGEVNLVVAPTSLLANWSAEIERFAPELRVQVAHPTLGEREPEDGKDVVLTSYGMLARLPWLKERRWGMVVLDEAQHIKNPSSRQSKLARSLQGAARVVVTGTPVENRPEDLWSLFDFLNPGLLGSSREFGAFVRKGLRGEASLSKVRGLVRPYLLRRLKSDPAVAADLPDKTEVAAWCPLSKRQIALYQREVDALALALEENQDEMRRRGAILAAMTRLKQLCDHPSLVLGDGAFEPEHSGKLERLAVLADEIAQRQERVLVFTQFREMVAPLAAFLTRIFGVPGLTLDGSTPAPQRKRLVDAFQQDDGPPFFVLSLKAGGVGLTLTGASHVIHVDRWWNPAVEDQATDRAHRIGQRHHVLVHKMMCRGTLDERIDRMIREKKALARDLVGESALAALTELPDREILELVALDLAAVSEDA